MKRPMWMCAADGAETGASTDAPPESGGLAAAFNAAMSAGAETPPESAPDPAAPEPVKKDEPKPEPPKSPKGEPKTFDGIPDGIFTEPAKPEEKKDPDFDSEALSKNLSSKGRENWKRMESHYQQRLDALAKERDEAKAAAQNATKSEEVDAVRKERDAMKAQLDEMNGVIERISLQHSPRFQQQFVKAREKLVNDAAKRVKQVGGDAEKFMEALALQGKDRYARLEEALTDAPTVVSTQIASLVTQIEDLDEQRAEAIKNGTQSLEQWQQEEATLQRQQAEKLLADKQRAADEIMDALPAEVLFLRKIDGNEAWNAKVEAMKSKAKDLLFNSNSYPDFVRASAKAAAYDDMQAAFVSLRDKYAEAVRQIEEMSASEPGAGTGGGSGSGPTDKAPENESLAQRYERAMQAA